MNETFNEIRDREKPNDVFYTPEKLSRFLIKQVNFTNDDSLLDPFKGKGAFYDNFPAQNKKDWFEILEGRDFFTINKKYDWFISNPPFSDTTKILEKTCLYADKGFAYLLPTYQMSYTRIKYAEKFGFYLNKIVYFQNPSEWQIGFQMAFFIFTRERSCSIKYETEDNTVQQTLYFPRTRRKKIKLGKLASWKPSNCD